MPTSIKDIDINIVRHLYNLKGKETTTYSLAQKIFDSNDVKDKNSFYSAKMSYINYRIEVLKKNGIIDISIENGKKVYSLIMNNVFFKRIKYKKIALDTTAVFLRIGGKWQTYIEFDAED